MSVETTPDDSTVRQVTFTVTVDADGTLFPPSNISYVDTARRRVRHGSDDVGVTVTPVPDTE